MSHIKVKTTYSIEAPYGSIESRTLYCDHSNVYGITAFYDEDGSYATMCFQECESGNDLFDAMLRLWSPFKDKDGKELKDGVEYYYTAPWEAQDALFNE